MYGSRVLLLLLDVVLHTRSNLLESLTLAGQSLNVERLTTFPKYTSEWTWTPDFISLVVPGFYLAKIRFFAKVLAIHIEFLNPYYKQHHHSPCNTCMYTKSQLYNEDTGYGSKSRITGSGSEPCSNARNRPFHTRRPTSDRQEGGNINSRFSSGPYIHPSSLTL